MIKITAAGGLSKAAPALRRCPAGMGIHLEKIICN